LEIKKSTRHQKVAGDFGEALILYWLSKYGFECANVDHTGIDIIARNPHTNEAMGISVKSRTRRAGTGSVSITMGVSQLGKVDAACKAFGCVPYFAFVIDADNSIKAFVVSQSHLLKIHPKGEKTFGWKMDKKSLERYQADSKIMAFEFGTSTHRWWKS
jgi:hypothetical protein